MYRSGQSFKYIAGIPNDESWYTSWSLPIVYAEYSARRGSLPPSGATHGYSAFPVAANLYDSSFTNSANAHTTSCTKLGKLIGPRVTWNTAFVPGPPPTMSMCTTALIRFASSAPEKTLTEAWISDGGN